MADFVTVKLDGVKELERKLRLMPEYYLRAAEASLYKSGLRIMERSVEEFVPVETGTLKSTWYVKSPSLESKGKDASPVTPQKTSNSVEVTLGYGGPAAPYAVAVHENPRAGKTGGVSPSGKKYRRWAKTGQWKYLETPLKEAVNDIANALVQDLNKVPETLA